MGSTAVTTSGLSTPVALSFIDWASTCEEQKSRRGEVGEEGKVAEEAEEGEKPNLELSLNRQNNRPSFDHSCF